MPNKTFISTNQFDYLTGLPNMTHFFELAEIGKQIIRENGDTPALIYTDFVGMKFYNLQYGFAEGDKLLQAFANVIAEIFGKERCCRIDADHFVIQSGRENIDTKIKELINTSRTLNNGKNLPIHIGVYIAQGEIVHSRIAYDRARLACQELDGKYETAINYYNVSLSKKAEDRQYIIENLDTAMKEKWIEVYIQPIVRAVNERVCDVEALARWNDPQKGLLPPDSFIPALEESGLIYKLDLYMVEQIIELIKRQEKNNFTVVSHSINLSRSDFDACDIVEEIRKRIDNAGIERNKITIEITESIIGSDFTFMKEQIERFRKLGFPVWMDDFGSGYSSLDVLQSIKFDLIKFDMSFLKKLDEGESGKIILTELMRMATSLGLDTVCEGVETKEQVEFLKEIGCSKLQGYYYSKPCPFNTIVEKLKDGTIIRSENPEETEYYENIGRVNLFDLGVISDNEENAFHNVFNTLPIAVFEISDSACTMIRCNQSYVDYRKRFFGVDISLTPFKLENFEIGYGETFFTVVEHCRKSGGRIFFNERMPDGSISHDFMRKVSINPITKNMAIVVAVLSVTDPDESTSYADIARALAADYYNIFVVDLDNDNYIEYSSNVGGEKLSIVQQGNDFFESARKEASMRIYDEDRDAFLTIFTKQRILYDLQTQGSFTATYRLTDTGKPIYVNMKITRMHGGNRIILGVSNVDAQMKQQEEEQRLRQEKITLSRIAALSPNYIVLYTVDLEINHYTEYNPSAGFKKIGLSSYGDDFFADTKKNIPVAIAPEDAERMMRVTTKENMLRVITESGFFIQNYHLFLNGQSVLVRLRATIVEDEGRETIIIGITNEQEEEYKRQLEEAYKNANSTIVIYNHLAHALARGYTDLYYVNMETDEFIEFHTDDIGGVLSEARKNNDFFEGCERDARLYIHPEEQEKFIRVMNRSFLEVALKDSKTYEFSYRRIKNDRTFYVQMRITRMEDDPRYIVIEVSDIDEIVKKHQLEEQIQKERAIYAALYNLAGNVICVYIVDPKTDDYREFNATKDYHEVFNQAKEGKNFFEKVRNEAVRFNYINDVDRFVKSFTKENILEEIDKNGFYSIKYRLNTNEQLIPVELKASIVDEKDGPCIIVGIYQDEK